jgi:hypothetical protein
MTPTWIAIIGGLCFLVGYLFAGYVTRYKLVRFKRWVNCKIGNHVPGRIQPAVGGRNIQRCDWCDVVVREYQVSQADAKRQQVRRIY